MQACLWLWATPQQYNQFWRNKLTFFIVNVLPVTEGEKWLITPEGAKPVFLILEGKTPVDPTSSQTQRQEPNDAPELTFYVYRASSEEVSWALAVGIVLPVPFCLLYFEAQNNCN